MNSFKKDFMCVVSVMVGGCMIESTGVWFVVACALIVVPAVTLIVKSLKTEEK